jgi:hypothetical protein
MKTANRFVEGLRVMIGRQLPASDMVNAEKKLGINPMASKDGKSLDIVSINPEGGFTRLETRFFYGTILDVPLGWDVPSWKYYPKSEIKSHYDDIGRITKKEIKKIKQENRLEDEVGIVIEYF